MPNIKFALRLLWKTPFVSLVAIVSLGLGIGANAAIFSLFNQMLVRPLPVHEPGRLVNFGGNDPNPGSQSCGQAGHCNEVFSYPMFRDLEREQKVFTGIAAHVLFGTNLSARNHTESGEGAAVSGTYFTVLGLRPALGRLIGPDDDRVIGESRIAVLSYDCWKTTFGLDPSVLNQTLLVNGVSLTIVGVAPQGFTSTTLGARPQVFVPITLRAVLQPDWDGFNDRRYYWAYLFARLKPGVTIEQARASLNVPYHAILNSVEAPLQEGISPKALALFRTKTMTLTPGARGQSTVIRQATAPLTLLLAVTVFVLLIACANIANLLLARGAARSGEMALRMSIGGSRAQLIGQLLLESLLLGLIGGAVSLGVARATLGAMASILPAFAAETFDVHLDMTVVWFTAAATLVTAFAFGLFPALHATRPDLISALRASTGQPSGGRSAARWRTSLATAQIALSMALLGAAGLFTKSLANISRVDLGLKIDHVVTFGVSPALNSYDAARTRQLLQRLTEALGQIPGVNGVTLSQVPLLAGSNRGHDVVVQGYPDDPDLDHNTRVNEIGPGYFSTLGVPLVAGREFSTTDGLATPRVAIINQAFARKFNLGASPVGKRMGRDQGKLDMEIVGLVQNAKYSEVKDDVPPQYFIPIQQDSMIGWASFYVRTSLDPRELAPMIPPVVGALDPNLPVEQLRTMPEQVRNNVFLDRFIGVLSAAFAGLATLLASIGLYGVLAYTVTQRTREIGVRMALGAGPARVRLMILRQVSLMTLVGGVIGIGAAIGLGRLAQSLLYRMQGYDPAVLGAAAMALTVVALGAGLIPAMRASRVDPTQALRSE